MGPGERGNRNRMVMLASLGSRRVAGAVLDSYREATAEAPQAPEVASDLARIQFLQGWTPSIELEELYLLASTVRADETIVEVGSYCGRSTAALALGAGCRDGAVVTIDPHTGDIAAFDGQSESLPSSEPVLRYNLALIGVESAVSVQVTTSQAAAEAYETPPPVGLLFVDGWHTRDAVVQDIESWSPHVASEATVVLDDWTWPSVMAGILDAERASLLPPRLGTVGGHLVFGSRPRIAHVLPRLRTLAQSSGSRRQYLRDRVASRSRSPSRSSTDPTPIA